jgi:hypothetical protein
MTMVPPARAVANESGLGDPRPAKQGRSVAYMLDVYYTLGRANVEEWLFLAFTVRRRRIRVISVRDMNQNERAIYAKYEKEDS